MSTGMINHHGNPLRIEALIVNDDLEAPSLLNPLTGQILITNSVGKRIIELADGSRSIAEIAAHIVREYRGAQEPNVTSNVEAFLASAVQKGIVTWKS